MNAILNHGQLASFLPASGSFYKERKSGNTHPFEIYTLEWLESQPSLWNDEWNKRNKVELVWVKKGKVNLQADGRNYEFGDNVIYRVEPGCPRSCFVESGTEGYYISFTPEFIRLSEGYQPATWMDQPGYQDAITAFNADEEIQYELEVIVRKMKREYVNYFSRKDELLKSLLNVFMIYFSRNIKDTSPAPLQTRENELARKFMSLLKKNFITRKMVSDYAGELFVTPNYLNRTVKKITGFTASHHIQQQIILEAKRLAIYSGESMKEIAYKLGFDNLAHFSKFFKNNSGMNFTSFKKGYHTSAVCN